MNGFRYHYHCWHQCCEAGLFWPNKDFETDDKKELCRESKQDVFPKPRSRPKKDRLRNTGWKTNENKLVTSIFKSRLSNKKINCCIFQPCWPWLGVQFSRTEWTMWTSPNWSTCPQHPAPVSTCSAPTIILCALYIYHHHTDCCCCLFAPTITLCAVYIPPPPPHRLLLLLVCRVKYSGT